MTEIIEPKFQIGQKVISYSEEYAYAVAGGDPLPTGCAAFEWFLLGRVRNIRLIDGEFKYTVRPDMWIHDEFDEWEKDLTAYPIEEPVDEPVAPVDEPVDAPKPPKFKGHDKVRIINKTYGTDEDCEFVWYVDPIVNSSRVYYSLQTQRATGHAGPERSIHLEDQLVAFSPKSK